MIYSISYEKRHGRRGLHLGGVAKFNHYLQMALPSVKPLSWSDLPGYFEVDAREYEMPEMLNDYLLRDVLTKDDIVIVDGYWGDGLQGKVKRLISVCHGTYLGRAIQYQITPWGDSVGALSIEKQKEFWSDERVEIVALARAGAREVRWITGREVPIIRTGVPLGIFRPMGVPRTALMHAAADVLKGADIIQYINREHDITIEHMSERSGDLEREARRLNDGKLCVSVSRYEGSSYFLNEALACGVPVVAYAVGQADEYDARCGIVYDNLSPENVVREIDNLINSPVDFAARDWAMEYCDFKTFRKEWRSYLDYSD